MILTANGNVQRLISSYYDTKHFDVQVHVLHCQLRPAVSTSNDDTATTITTTTTNTPTTTLPQIWDRKVELCLYFINSDITNHSTVENPWPDATATATTTTTTLDPERHHSTSSTTITTTKPFVFCTATSVITIHDVQCQRLIALQQIGIGQLFRYFNILPNFTLHDAGPLHPSHWKEETKDRYAQHPNMFTDGGGGNFWREYTLSCPQLSCWIREEFPPGLWNQSSH
jgi:hypothetical protein